MNQSGGLAPTRLKSKSNQLCLMRVTLDSLATDKPVALGFQIELEFGNVGFFVEGGKQGRGTTNSTHI